MTRTSSLNRPDRARFRLAAGREGVGVKILVVDVGGNNVKLLATGHTVPAKVPSGPDLTPDAHGGRDQEDDPRLEVGRRHHRLPRLGEGRPSRPRAQEPRRGLGALQLPARLRQARPHHQRRRDAGARQLRGRAHALPRPRAPASGPPSCSRASSSPSRSPTSPTRTARPTRSSSASAPSSGWARRAGGRWSTRSWRISTRPSRWTRSSSAAETPSSSRRFPTVARLGSNSNAFAGGFRLWKDPLAGKSARTAFGRPRVVALETPSGRITAC